MTVWLPVLGWEMFYEVSDQGDVRSLHRASASGPRILRTRVSRRYLHVGLSAGGRKQSRSVHSLVAEAFHGPRPSGMQVRHLDGDAFNNRPGNLAWGTPKENSADAIVHGVHPNVAKTVCPRGHALAGLNLNPSRLKRGLRCCRSCMTSFEMAREDRRKRRYRVRDAATESDLRYARWRQQDPTLPPIQRRATNAAA